MQQTLRTSIHARGAGRRCGRTVHLAIHPAAENTGIVFRRTDVTHASDIRATLEHACSGNGMRLKANGFSVDAVEHLLAACYGMGINNAVVELDGPEVPMMDGSAAPFVFLLQAAGVQKQTVARAHLTLRKMVSVKSRQGWARLLPCDGLHVACIGPHSNTKIHGFGRAVLDISQAMFRTMLCHAGANRLRQAGEEINERCEIFNRKDVLGALADFCLLNSSLHATYVGYNADRALNLNLMRRLIGDASAWTVNVRQDEVVVDSLVAASA